VPSLTTAGFAAAVPLRVLVTNSEATPSSVTAVESHGPLMPLPLKVSATRPLRSRTIRQPAAEFATVPSVEGVLPTTTQPPGRTTSAVVRPTPPGHGPGSLFASIVGPSTDAGRRSWNAGAAAVGIGAMGAGVQRQRVILLARYPMKRWAADWYSMISSLANQTSISCAASSRLPDACTRLATAMPRSLAYARLICAKSPRMVPGGA
jgi:hypothetical protein